MSLTHAPCARRAVLLLVATLSCLALLPASVSAFGDGGQQSSAPQTGRPTPLQMRDAWRALKAAMLATRNADNRQAITAEEAEKQFAALADAAKLLGQGYDEPASGKVLPPGGTITGDALVGGYFPTLARAYCSWMAAQRTTDLGRQYAYYTAVYESLWHGAAEEPVAKDAKPTGKVSRQLHVLYDSAMFRSMAIAAALARRNIVIEQARRAGEADAAGPSVSAEISEYLRLKEPDPNASPKVDALPDVEDIVGKSGYLKLLQDSVVQVLRAELAKSAPRFRSVAKRDDWQAEGRTKVIAGAIDSISPVTVRAVDARSGQPIPNAQAKNVTGPFDIRVDLEEKPEPTLVQLVLEGELVKEPVAFAEQITLWNIPQPVVSVASRQRSISDVVVTDLSFSVERVRADDVLVAVAVDDGARRVLLEQKVAQAGNPTVVVPKFTVKPNSDTRVLCFVRRGDRDLPAEEIRVTSRTTPLISARMLKVNDLVSLVQVDVSDFASAVSRITMNGFDYPAAVKPVETVPGSGDARSRFTYLLPWTGVGRGVTVSARTTHDSEPLSVPWSAEMPSVSADDVRLARLPDYQRELAKGDLSTGEKAYTGVLVDPAYAVEARAVLGDLYDYRLRRAPAGATPEVEAYLSDLRLLAKSVGRDGDLDARIAQVRKAIADEKERQRLAKEEEEAKRRAAEAKQEEERKRQQALADAAAKARREAEQREQLEKTPVDVSVQRAVYSDADGVLHLRLDVKGLVLGRSVKAVQIDGVAVDGSVAHVLSVDPDASKGAATVEAVCVPSAGAPSIKVTVTVTYPGSGDVPKSINVDVKPGAADGMSATARADYAFLKDGRPEGTDARPGWLVQFARRRAAVLIARAAAALALVTKDPRPATAVKDAQSAIARAIEYGDALKAVTGQDEAIEARKQQTTLSDVLKPSIKARAFTLAKKKTGGGHELPAGSTLEVASWADQLSVKIGQQAVEGMRQGGVWRFALAGSNPGSGSVKAVAVANVAGLAGLQDEQDIKVEMPASSVAFSFKKPDFVYCDDGTGTRRLVFNATDAGRNAATTISFECPQAKLMAWEVLTDKGDPVAGTRREPSPPPVDDVLQIPDGKLGLGAYNVRVSLWDSDDAAQTPAKVDVPIRIAPRAVAFLVGINHYGGAQAELRHAADDALALRSKLIERGYAPENIIYVVGRNTEGTPELRTNGVQNPKSDTPNDLSPVSRTGGRFGLANEAVVRRAFSDAMMKVVAARRAQHVLIFFAGHGYNVKGTAGGSDVAIDSLVMADIGDNPKASVAVYDWPKQIQNSVRWGSREAPVTIMCIYDACRNGSVRTLEATPPELRSDDGAVVCSALFSCRKGEQANENVDSDPKLAVAYENEVFRNGFFTYALLRGLDALPAQQARLPDLLEKAAPVLSALVSQTPSKNQVAGAPKPYSEKQSLRPKDDLRRWEEPLYVVYPVVQANVGWIDDVLNRVATAR